MDTDTLMFFDRMPKALPLYEAFAARLRSELDHVTVKVQKTQISFSNKYNFAFISLPIRKMKGRPDVYMIVSFGLGYQMEDKESQRQQNLIQTAGHITSLFKI